MEYYIDSFARKLALAGNREVAQMVEYGRCTTEEIAELTGLAVGSVELAYHFILRFPDKDVIFENHSGFDFAKVESIPAKRSCMRIEHIILFRTADWCC